MHHDEHLIPRDIKLSYQPKTMKSKMNILQPFHTFPKLDKFERLILLETGRNGVNTRL
jgi:hypothetical protein